MLATEATATGDAAASVAEAATVVEFPRRLVPPPDDSDCFMIRETADAGLGVFCNRPCPKGSILRFWGREGKVKAKNREEATRAVGGGTYCLCSREDAEGWSYFVDIDEDRRMDCLAFFSNEPSPGQEITATCVRDEVGLLLRTCRDLAHGDDLLWFYGNDYLRYHYPKDAREFIEEKFNVQHTVRINPVTAAHFHEHVKAWMKAKCGKDIGNAPALK